LEHSLSDKALEKNRKYRETQSNLSRANYAVAWIEYNLGLLAEGADRVEHFKKSIEIFTRFTSDGYRNHPIVADCFLGQALCYYELGDYGKVIEFLKPADRDTTEETTFKRMTYLRLKTYQCQRRNRELHETAEKYFDARDDEHRFDAVELSMALEWARSLAVLAGDPKANPYYRQYRKRMDKLAAIVSAYGEPWGSKMADLAGKASGSSLFSCLRAAREQFASRSYEEVLQHVDKALNNTIDDLKPEGDNRLLADLRYIQAAAAWNLQRWRQAHLAAFELLRHHREDPRAHTMFTHALDAAIKAIKARPRLESAEFHRFGRYVNKNFPTDPLTEKITCYRADLLIESKEYIEAGQLLRTIKPTSTMYRRAQYGLALGGFKQAKLLADNPGDKSDLAKQTELLKNVVQAARQYLKATEAGPEKDGQWETKAMIDVILATGQLVADLPEHDLADIATLPDILDKLAKILPKAGYSADDRLALKIQLLVKQDKISDAAHYIDTLLDHQKTGLQPRRVMIDIADGLEAKYSELEKVNNDDRIAVLDEKLIRIYNILLAGQGTDKGLINGRQEISIRWRLARSLQRTGRNDEAITHYEWLFKQIPEKLTLEKSGDILQGLARAYEENQEYEAAIEKWRVLSRGLKKDTEAWFETRYHLMLCHKKAGRLEHARKLLAYLKLQYPRIKFKKWRNKYNALEQELAGRVNTNAHNASETN